MKFDVDDKNRCRLVCVKFHLNRCRFVAAVAKCLGGSLFWDTVYMYVRSDNDALLLFLLLLSLVLSSLCLPGPVHTIVPLLSRNIHLASAV